MPVYLVFLQVAKKKLALRGPNLPASFQACKLRQGRHLRILFMFHIVKIECQLICSNPIARKFSYIKPTCIRP
jgi:hypothetical protein